MICSLKEQVDDVVTLAQVFKKRGITIETIGWPSREKELRSLKVSLSIARKKLRSLILNRANKLRAFREATG